MHDNKTVIILVNYNGTQLTLDCIESINKGTVVPDVIVIDNNSNAFDRSLFEGYSNVIVIENDENLGFSGGNNVAINYALRNDYSYLMLLNNDTIIDKYMVETLLNKIDENLLLVPKMYYYSNPRLLWYAGGYFNKLKGEAFHIGIGEEDVGQYDEERYVSFATGCCLFADKNVYEQLQGFSEEYFMYCEDTDFCLRCQEEGVKVYYVPSAKLWHKVGASAGNESVNSVYYRNRNRFYLIKKHNLGVVPFLYTFFSRALKYYSSFLLHNNNYVIKQAFLDYKSNKMFRQVVMEKK